MFQHLPFPFKDGRFPPQLGAVVQTAVINGKEPARSVIHTDDNSWLVGDGINDPNLPGAAVAFHMHHVLQTDPSLDELAGLPLGHIATRGDLDAHGPSPSMSGQTSPSLVTLSPVSRTRLN